METDYSPRRLLEQDPARRPAGVGRMVELRFGWSSDIPRRRSLSGMKRRLKEREEWSSGDGVMAYQGSKQS